MNLDVTMRKIIYDIGNLYRSGDQSDDEPLSDRQKAYIVNIARQEIIYEYARKGQKLDKQFEQVLNCVDVIRVPHYECCDLPSETHVRRTSEKLPIFLPLDDTREGRPTYMGGISGFNEFQYLPPHRVKPSIYDVFTGGMRKATLLNRYGYFINDEELEKVQIRGPLANPFDSDGVGEENETTCNTWDSPYPIPGYMIAELKRRVLQFDINTLLKGMPDNVNDGTGTLK